MKERLVEELTNKIKLKKVRISEEVKQKIYERFKEGNLTRDKNPTSHFSTFFMAVDVEKREVFVGLHKKARIYLPNGGHIDQNENSLETVVREVGEEWGDCGVELDKIEGPELITITYIDNERQKCKVHFDLWFFIKISKENFYPEQVKLDTEFTNTGWVKINEIKNLVSDRSVLEAIEYLSERSNRSL